MIRGPPGGITTVRNSPSSLQLQSKNGFVVFTQQGYFVIAINPTGSLTFGQGGYTQRSRSGVYSLWFLDFVDAITEDWGGKPFIDLQKGWKYALNKYPEVRFSNDCDLRPLNAYLIRPD